MLELRTDLAMPPDQFLDLIAAGIERFRLAVRELAAQGWTVPMHLTPAEVYDILAVRFPEETDAAFVQLYEANQRAQFEVVAAGLLHRNTLEPWHRLLAETIEAARRRQFRITVPALLTVLEGAVMRDAARLRNVRSAVAAEVLKRSRSGPGSISLLAWESVQLFVDGVFKAAKFTGDRPALINRHWILHGRDAVTWTEADSIRLLQAVDTVSSLLSRDGPAGERREVIACESGD